MCFGVLVVVLLLYPLVVLVFLFARAQCRHVLAWVGIPLELHATMDRTVRWRLVVGGMGGVRDARCSWLMYVCHAAMCAPGMVTRSCHVHPQ